MHTPKGTTLKALQPKQQQQEQQTNNNGVGESSFRVLYYGSSSTASVPFMWESQPGTPKHALTESSLPPLTPPPSYHQFTQKYNSSMQVVNLQSSKRSGLFRKGFLDSSWKRNTPLSSSVSSSSSSSSWQSMSKEGGRVTTTVKFGFEDDGEDGGSPTSTLCFGGEFKRSYRIKKMKKAMLAFVRNVNGNGKA